MKKKDIVAKLEKDLEKDADYSLNLYYDKTLTKVELQKYHKKKDRKA